MGFSPRPHQPIRRSATALRHEAADYEWIIDVLRQPALDLPDHAMLVVGADDGTGFWFPLPTADGRDAAFEADLVARFALGEAGTVGDAKE